MRIGLANALREKVFTHSDIDLSGREDNDPKL